MIRIPILLLGISLLAATAMAQQTGQQAEPGQKSGMGSAASQSGPLGTGGLTYDSTTDAQKSNLSGLGMPGTAATQNSSMHSGSDFDDGTRIGRPKH